MLYKEVHNHIVLTLQPFPIDIKKNKKVVSINIKTTFQSNFLSTKK
ncbi:hypothetical protein HMPREF1991_00079 [Hoylesella loescheii DSM 19665 = JCM 12249 = ATCC 15930]|uniref:Uncharacterized protein n=1 Tax=Hoylesella loescheii DSM 19665 = JCM 12249 = ATCC 15930 TaxID=1122985 RepID=A0A069QLI5_HOYLO|nr:hypothetical protein HMPREF1991_00079 [Hoylesella loescheii DSM 19665 = JCM 12249 = ATCC 15930]